MKKFVLVLTSLGMTVFCFTGMVRAEEGAIRTIAQITMNLNHFPTDDDKATLNAIVDNDDSSEEEANIAMALANFEHKIVEKDTERLSDIVDDDSADADARKLAGILLRTNHSPSDEDKATLAALAEK